MTENNEKNVTTISQAASLEAVGAFWDTHSLADYEAQTQEVEFDVRAKRKRRVALAPEVYEQIAAQALTRGIQPETLVNLWLAERLHTTG